MLLEYNYEKANYILEQLNASNIAYLCVGKGDGDAYIMDYALVSDYPEAKQKVIRDALLASLPERLNVTNLFNSFIENYTLDNLVNFSLKFNAVNVLKCEASYSLSTKRKTEDISMIRELANCLERFDQIVTKMGIHEQQTAVFKREGGGKSKKYTSLTVGEVGSVLRQSLEG